MRYSSKRSGQVGKLRNENTKLTASFTYNSNGIFSGYVYDLKEPLNQFVVELIVDGWPIRLARADTFVEQLSRQGHGCYGFTFVVPSDLLSASSVVEVRLANSAASVAPPIYLDQLPSEEKITAPLGDTARWLGGLRFSGVISQYGSEAPTVTAVIDGLEVARVEALKWHHLESTGMFRPAKSFDLYLPTRFADGQVHTVLLRREDNRLIPPGGITFVAFPHSLESLLDQRGNDAEKLRGQLFDRLVPASAPFSEYAAWKERFPNEKAQITDTELAIILVGDGDENFSLNSLDKQRHQNWVVAVLPTTEHAGMFNPSQLQTFLNEETSADIFVFALNGTKFLPDSLDRISEGMSRNPDILALYGDVEVQSSSNNEWPIAFPAFDYERMLEQGYCALFFAFRRAPLQEALRAGYNSLFRVFNSIFDSDTLSALRVAHVPGALCCLPRLDIEGLTCSLEIATSDHLSAHSSPEIVIRSDAQSLPAVHLRRAASGSTTIIIPVRNKPDLLKSCLATIGPAAKKAAAHILIIDNGSDDPLMTELLHRVASRGIKVLRAPGYFNFARLNNLAAEVATTDNLLLLNNDVQALDADWLEEMQSRLAPTDAGAVGALLLWPSGVVQHGGVALGASFAATHAFNDRMDGDPGYSDMLRVARETSAVTAACLLTRRSDYLAVGGMDEVMFPVNFQDVDYCLKLRAAGKRVIFTPHAKLLHLESASRGRDTDPDRASRFARELSALRAKWGEVLMNDPYYNPMLSLDPIPFSALAWPPRSWSSRLNCFPTPRLMPTGL